MDNTWDFKGWATYYNTPCADNRIIEPGCFKEQDGQSVPLFIDTYHFNIFEDCIGHAILEAREEGIYCYGYFFEDKRVQIENTKMMLQEGILKSLGIMANKLDEEKRNDGYTHVKNAKIRYVSILGNYPSNPEARIEVIQI